MSSQLIKDEDSVSSLQLSVTNMLTGEISEKEIVSMNDAKDFYLQLKAALLVFKKAEDRLKSWMDYNLGDNETYEFPDGKIIKRVYRSTKTWTFEGLKQIGLDEDNIALCSKVDMTTAKALIKEMVERGDIKPGSAKILEETADIKAQKPFIEVK